MPPIYFLTYVEPVNPQEGKEVLFVVREQDKEKKIFRSHNIIKEIPHIFVGRREKNELIEEICKKLVSEERFRGIDFVKKSYGEEKSFIWAMGSKEDKKILPDYFIKKNEEKKNDPLGLNSPSRLLRWLYSPLMLVKSPDKIPDLEEILRKKRTFATIEDVLDDKSAVIDIEVEGWEEGKDKIFMAIVCSAKETLIYHNLNFNEMFFEDIPLIKVDSQEDFGQALTEKVLKEDYLWLGGHRLMSYDNLKLRELTKAYFPATNQYKPIIKSSQSLPKVLTKGRITIDTYSYAFYHLNIYKNNKLSTLADFVKIFSHQEQVDLVKRARTGDLKAMRTLFKYCLEDGKKSFGLMEKFKESTVLKMKLYRRDAESICAGSPFNVAGESWQRRFFIIKGAFEDDWKQYYQEEKKFNPDKFKLYFLKKDFQEGYFEKVHCLYLTPFLKTFHPLLGPDGREILKRMKDKSPEEKFDLARTLNIYLAEIIWKLLSKEARKTLSQGSEKLIPKKLKSKISENFEINRKKGFALAKSYGLPLVNDFEEFNQDMERNFYLTNKALEHYKIINYSQFFYLLEGEIRAKELEEKLFGVYLGHGPVLSFAKGKFIINAYQTNDHRKFIYQGIDLGLGKKPKFEKELMAELVELILTGEKEKAGDLAKKRLRRFKTRKLPLEEYLIRENTRTYYKNKLLEILERNKVNQDLVGEYKKIKNKIIIDKKLPEEVEEVLDKIKNIPFPSHLIEEYVNLIKFPYPPDIFYGYEEVSEEKYLELPKGLFSYPAVKIYLENMKKNFGLIFKQLSTKKI